MRVDREPIRATSDQRGIALVFVAICLVVFCGVAAISIDLGNGWVTRRNLITSTDAASLASAQEYAAGNNGCDTIDETYVLLNNPSATGITCTPGGAADAGWVTVYAEDNVDTWFATVIGQGDFLASSASTARWGTLRANPEGLRPIAMCVNALMSNGQTVGQWFAAGGEPNNLVATIRFSNPGGQPDLCNVVKAGKNVPGNWGLVDFDGTAGNNTKEWFENGYDGDVPVIAGTVGNGCPDSSVPESPHACYPPQTGEVTQAKAQIEALFDVAGVIVPIIDYSIPAGGSNTRFHIVGFASIIFRDGKLVGKDEDRFLEVEFVKVVTAGDIGAGGGPGNVSVVQACAVDNVNLGACSP